MASNPTKTSNIEDKTDFWRIPGVNYRNGIYVVDLGKVLLNNGSSKTQDRWAEDSRKAIPKGEFHVGDFPLYHALFKALYERRTDHTTEEARRFISDNMVNSG
ncbi:hypothetical protein HYT58_00955 [Candidatus Woesearchaeota archaeon]|nr:hypothetical protein [Candidatus Woesearchaeota archaeon]